jgi:hypothetical protein
MIPCGCERAFSPYGANASHGKSGSWARNGYSLFGGRAEIEA